jgi:outer membrane protein TolC
MKSRRQIAAALFLLLVGCATTQQDREDAAREMQDRLVAETRDYFAAHPEPLTFTNALAIARERSLKLTQKELDVQLAKITSAAAFSAFLPNVELAYGRTMFSGKLSGLLPATSFQTPGWNFENAGMIISQPVFTPVAWTLFAETLYGIRIREHIRARAQQLLDVQVAVKFYDAAVAARLVKTRELQVKSGEALTNRVARLAAEGYASPAEKARAETRLASDEYALLQAKSAQEKARQALADILHFWPLAEFEVDGDSLVAALGESGRRRGADPTDDGRARSPLRAEMKDLPELVWQALVSREDLRAADETLALRKAQVIEALAGFLPNVVLGGGGGSLSLESVAVRGWAGSLVGVWSVFGGFRTVQEYRAARAMREAEFRLNEDRMLAVVVSVADCWRNLETVRAGAAVAAKGAEATTLDHEEAARRFDDGRETMATVLDKATTRDEAEVVLVKARYAEALATIMLKQAIGEEVWNEK